MWVFVRACVNSPRSIVHVKLCFSHTQQLGGRGCHYAGATYHVILVVVLMLSCPIVKIMDCRKCLRHLCVLGPMHYVYNAYAAIRV